MKTPPDDMMETVRRDLASWHAIHPDATFADLETALRSGAQRVVAAKCRLDQSRMSPYLGMMVVGISPILALAFVVPRFGTHATLISIEADVGWIMALVESGLPGWHADQCSDASRGGTHFYSVAEVPRLSGEVKITRVPLRAGPRASAPTGAGTP